MKCAMSLLLLIFLSLVEIGKGIKQQIGHIPMSGNLWRTKYSNEISGNVSSTFSKFALHCRQTHSEQSGILYYYSPNSTIYPFIDSDDTICAYSLERHVSADEITDKADYIRKFTLYFACDDTCCAMECCERDITMSIIGLSLIGFSLLILIFYATVYIGGMCRAWKNGSLGRRPTVSGHSASMSFSKNGNHRQSINNNNLNNNECNNTEISLMIKNSNFDNV